MIACPSCKRRIFTSHDLLYANLDGTARCRACGHSARLDLLSRWMISIVISLLFPIVFLYGNVFYSGHFFIACIFFTLGASRLLSFITSPFLALEVAAPSAFNRRQSILTLVVLAVTALVLDNHMSSRFEAEDAQEKGRSASAVQRDR